MNDFTVMLTNMPPNKFFAGDDDLLRIKLWDHLEKVLVQQILVERPDIHEGSVYGPKTEVVDITFAKNNIKDTKIIHDYAQLRKEMLLEIGRKSKMEDPAQQAKSEKKISALEQEMQEEKAKYLEHHR